MGSKEFKSRRGSRIRLNEDQKEILILMGKVVLWTALGGIALAAFATSPFGVYKLTKLFIEKHPEFKNRERDIEKVAQKILKDKLVKIVKKGDQHYLITSALGRRRLIEYNINTVKIKRQKWDGRWRIAMFDIPEKMRLARDVLREKLKELGFKQVQKSVWVCPFECQDEINFIASVYDVQRYVNYLVTEKTDFSNSLKKTLGVRL